MSGDNGEIIEGARLRTALPVQAFKNLPGFVVLPARDAVLAFAQYLLHGRPQSLAVLRRRGAY